MTNDEQRKLEEISQWYSNVNFGFYTKLVYFGFETIKSYFKKGNILEVGPADGEMTKFLLSVFSDITVVDASKNYVDIVKKLDFRIKGVISLIEDFNTTEKFDNILLAHVLEHVQDPTKVLLHLKKFLKKAGRIFIIVPNAMSFNRQVGVEMGVITKVTDLDDSDKKVGHRRVYTQKTLIEDIAKAELKIKKSGGIFLKPLTNQQIHEQWSNNLIEGYYRLGKKYPELCAELFVVCVK